MVPQVADYRGKWGTGKKGRVGGGGVTAGSERQINGRRRERGIEEGAGRIERRLHGKPSEPGWGGRRRQR